MRIFYALGLFILINSAYANEVYDVYKNGSVENGKKLFTIKQQGQSFESCTSCHTENTMNMGKHAKTGKDIKPLAPAANPNRFTDLEKTEKWFKRNCPDVFGKECSAKEKADIIAWLRSVK